MHGSGTLQTVSCFVALCQETRRRNIERRKRPCFRIVRINGIAECPQQLLGCNWPFRRRQTSLRSALRHHRLQHMLSFRYLQPRKRPSDAAAASKVECTVGHTPEACFQWREDFELTQCSCPSKTLLRKPSFDSIPGPGCETWRRHGERENLKSPPA